MLVTNCGFVRLPAFTDGAAVNAFFSWLVAASPSDGGFTMRLAHLVLPALLGFLLVGCSPDEDDQRDLPPADTMQPAPPVTPDPPVVPGETTPPAPTTAPESDFNTNPGTEEAPAN